MMCGPISAISSKMIKRHGDAIFANCNSFKKLQVTQYTELLTSRDACCRFLAQRQRDHDNRKAKIFLASVEANQILSQHPELSRKQISKHASTEVTKADTRAHLHHVQSLYREKRISCSKRTKHIISGK